MFVCELKMPHSDHDVQLLYDLYRVLVASSKMDRMHIIVED